MKKKNKRTIQQEIESFVGNQNSCINEEHSFKPYIQIDCSYEEYSKRWGGSIDLDTFLREFDNKINPKRNDL